MGRDAIQNSGQDSVLDVLQVLFGSFDQANTAGLLRERLVPIVPDLGAGFRAGTEAFEIGEPVEFTGVQREQIRQFRDRFNLRDGPRSRGRHWLHVRGLSEPPEDVKFRRVFQAGAVKIVVGPQECHDIPETGASSAGPYSEVALRERRHPVPGPPQSLRAAVGDLFDSRFACEKSSGENAHKRRFRHGQRRRRLQRVLPCVSCSANRAVSLTRRNA